MSTTPIFNELAEAAGLELDEDGTLAAANGSTELTAEGAAEDGADEDAGTPDDEAGTPEGETAEGTPAKHMQRAAS